MSESRALKPMQASRQYMAEIVGEESLHGHRMQAGAILDLMDVLAAKVASTHAGSSVVTLSFDRVELSHPIFHQDMVRLEGQVVAMGRSSIMVAVDVYRQDFLSREYQPIQHSYITMVAIDDHRRPKRDIPGLAIQSEADHKAHEEALAHKARTTEWLRLQELLNQRQKLDVAEVEEVFNKEKRELLAPEETELRVRRLFMPRHTNVLGTIFGGDILLWMDRVATQTARQFTRNRNVITLAMNRIFFNEPIFTSDLVEMVAQVVYVRRYTLEVEITVTLERADGTVLPSHSGHFTVLNYDEGGFKRPILTGLRLDAGDQNGLRRYFQARERHRFWRKGLETSP
ncbi:MAG: hypothetical protein OEW39_06560 [Deltaproteobacteria bacterium]|nr:hypothetical protein [Deltaproteobacteria bacterium]